LKRALTAGVTPKKIIFAGVGKTAGEMAAALDAGILQFNVESVPELEELNRVALAKGARAPVAIRVNPDVDALTHAKIATGKAENKFGIDLPHAPEAYARARSLAGIEIVGIAVHIGSQLADLAPYRTAFTRVAALARELKAQGHPIRRLALGGGLGIGYGSEPAPSIAEYAGLARSIAAPVGAALAFEPGRLLVGNAGVLVTRILYVKQGIARRFAIVDAGMNDLLRPALYDAYHAILPVAQPASAAPSEPVDVVGPVCENADVFAVQRPLPPLAAGDLLAICSAGAYGAVMSSFYNARPPAPEIMVRGPDHAIVRPRADLDAIIAEERLPGWLAGTPAARPSRGAA
jgi:diaminopimelate decarboxylase